MNREIDQQPVLMRNQEELCLLQQLLDVRRKEVRIGTNTKQSYFPMQLGGTAVKNNIVKYRLG
jgi:hypothetical protein